MDYRKDVRTPRDRVDDDLLRRILGEEDEKGTECGAVPAGIFGNGSRNRIGTGGSSCGKSSGRKNSASLSDGCAGKNTGSRTGCGWNADRRMNGCCEHNDGNQSHGWNAISRPDGCCEHECEISCMNRKSLSVQTYGLPLVMSYAPDHEFAELYEEEEALLNGTLFRPLNFPFYPGKCGKNCGCGS